MKLKTLLNARYLKTSAMLLAAVPCGLLLRKVRPRLMLVSERPDQARDNGFCFYRYLRAEHPEEDAVYVISADAADKGKLPANAETLDYDSWRHYVYYCASKIHVSAHIPCCRPTGAPLAGRMKKTLGYRDVFIPHGVCYGVAEFCLKRYADIDLFVCACQADHDNVLGLYGYGESEVALLGYPRLDGWHDAETDPKLITVMPTWRLYLAQDPNTVFEETEYFRAYRKLLRSGRLSGFLRDNGLRLVFYLHNDMRKYADSFQTDCPDIEIVRDDGAYDIQELLKSSAVLVTDYSSVAFDFAYMGKPVAYYQFDQEEFFERQYRRGLFDFERDGFGPVSKDISGLLASLEELYREGEGSGGEGFAMPSEYRDRMRSCYVLHDRNNCERVYRTIREKMGMIR